MYELSLLLPFNHCKKGDRFFFCLMKKYFGKPVSEKVALLWTLTDPCQTIQILRQRYKGNFLPLQQEYLQSEHLYPYFFLGISLRGSSFFRGKGLM
jgi:hypothetical protein